MNKIIVLSGPPASGKTVFARDYIQTHKDCVIVNRDDFRSARGDYWVPSQEDYISDIEEAAVRSALKRGLTPIIDATNLNPKTISKWNTIADEFGVEVETKSFYIPFKDAVERDRLRGEAGGRSVGEKVLKDFYLRYFEEEFRKEVYTDHTFIRNDDNLDLPPCIVVDLDGTVALHQGRSPFEWDKIDTDKCDPRMKQIIERYILNGVNVIFLTGRNKTAVAYAKTFDWLAKYFPYYKTDMNTLKKFYKWNLIMRAEKDYRPAPISKKELFEQYVDGKYNVLAVFEDSNRCVEMWRSLGLLTLQPADNA